MMLPLIWRFVFFLNYVVLAYFVALNLSYFALTLISLWKIKDYRQLRKNLLLEEMIGNHIWPPVSLIAPAHNEEKTCVDSIKSLLSLVYPDYEIVFVNDGSTDGTVRTMADFFDMEETERLPISDLATAKVKKVFRSKRHPNLLMVDKEKGGKADALNCGINYSRSPLFCALDADSFLERDSIKKIAIPFIEDTSTVAVGGIIRIANGCRVENGLVTEVRMPRGILAKFQVMEYLRAFLSGRMGWSGMDATLIISGAFGMFRRSVVASAGGFRCDTVGEDMELIIRLHHYCRKNRLPYRILFIPDPVAWTECPETLKQLGKQRDRWQRGLIESLLSHTEMLFNPRYGRIGMVAFPYFFFLEMMGPLVEFLGYLSFVLCFLFGRINNLFMVAFFMTAFCLGIALSIASIGLEELSFRRYSRFSDFIQLFLLSIVEILGYRQLQTFWRAKGVLSFISGTQSWGAMERKGIGKKALITLLLAGTLLFGRSNAFSAEAHPPAAAEAAFQGHDFVLAAEIYRGILKEKPDSHAALFGLARSLAFSNRWEESLQAYDKLLGLYPDDLDARLARGRVLGWSGARQRAELDIKFVLERNPDYLDAWDALGDLYAWEHRPEEALDAYEKEKQLAPGNPKPLISRAKILIQTRRFPQAREELFQAQKLGGNTREADELLRTIDRIPAAFAWEAYVDYNYQSYAPNRGIWTIEKTAIVRELGMGSIGLEGIASRRFGKTDLGIALDNYFNLWKRSYGNFRWQNIPGADIFPRHDIYSELFQGFGLGWEASFSHQHSDFSGDDSDRYGLGLAKYQGPWYLRAKSTMTPAHKGIYLSHSAYVRRFGQLIDDFVELSGGAGKQSIPQGASHIDRKSVFVAVRAQKFVSPRLGFSLSGERSDLEKTYRETGFHLKTILRW